jgi:hypothetical protein
MNGVHRVGVWRGDLRDRIDFTPGAGHRLTRSPADPVPARPGSAAGGAGSQGCAADAHSSDEPRVADVAPAGGMVQDDRGGG